jgi:hypothetical protein
MPLHPLLEGIGPRTLVALSRRCLLVGLYLVSHFGQDHST